MDIKVSVKYAKHSPKKVRLVTNLIKGMTVEEASGQLRFLDKQVKQPVVELLKSAVAAAKDKQIDPQDLYVKSIVCSQGPSLKRINYGSKGRAIRIKKRMSHIYLTISDDKNQTVKADKQPTQAAKKEVKKNTKSTNDKKKNN